MPGRLSVPAKPKPLGILCRDLCLKLFGLFAAPA
jgi:hypothetical protein